MERLKRQIENKFERYRELIPDWETFLASAQQPLPTCIWTNTLRIEANALFELLQKEGVELEPVSWYPGAFRWKSEQSPGRHWTYWAGFFHIQEEASLIPVALLDPRPGHRVLDLCAAPGGKSAQIGVRLANSGTLIANDRNRARMSPLNFVLNRLGLINVTTTVQDGVNYPRKAGLFDRILVDAPCSCEGTLRKNPEILKKISEKVYQDQQRIQTLLLEKAVHLCRVGGRIAYATCTFAPEENENVVQRVLNHFGPSVLRIREISIPGLQFSEGLTQWQADQFSPEMRKSLRLYPHQNNTGGFFVTLLEKVAESSSKITLQGREVSTNAASRAGGFYGDQISQDSDEIIRCRHYLIERFGIPETIFSGVELFLRRRNQLYLCVSDHRVPPLKCVSRTGLMLMKSDPKYPKLSTEAAMMLGSFSVKHVVDLNRSETHRYMRREKQEIHKRYCAGYTEPGYVLVRYAGAGIGMGFLRFEPGRKTGWLESLYPKSWYENGEE